eukprot:gnl/Hemi2/10333_TR3565_c0_g1_i1.p2 gnl/Hemi2/10333_TR3565_c0_g1~~gnl/Hemi2/10333_TR3565_c0_g1_i1.p2  ORF type:complete len:538 (-),score=214.23 gnl/Hemi2/10333_TR3565_c0_g1_i1:157-1770(-)
MIRSPLADLLKDGAKHLSGIDEAVLKNIEAVKEMAQITRTSMGPNGMNKIIINHLGKQFVTSDAATMLKELEVVHPAAKLLVMASQRQDTECGDGTNLVLALGGELMHQAEGLLRMGLHTSDIISGFLKASTKAQEILETLECAKLNNIRDKVELARVLRTVVGSKQYGQEDTLTGLIAEAAIMIMPRTPANFNVENLRSAKILGASLASSAVFRGCVVTRDTEGSIKHLAKAKIAIFAGGMDAGGTETKGNVILRNADELMKYNISEEQNMEKIIKGIADAGVTAVVCGGTISEMAAHFLQRYNIMSLKVPSKFELRRICRTTCCPAMVRLGTPTAEEMGAVDNIDVVEIGSQKVTVFNQDSEISRVSTIVLRGSTENQLDDVERTIDDAANAVRNLARDPRLCPGGGATEIELSLRVRAFAETLAGLEQYAIKQFGEAFEVVAHTLAENAGQKPTEVISSLYAAHATKGPNYGVDIENGGVRDMVEAGVLDVLATKLSAIRQATDAVCTILRVDQIIMMRQAGGPTARSAAPEDQ